MAGYLKVPATHFICSGQSIMSIEVTCDDCGRDFRVNEASAGRKVKCKCGASVRVPDEDDFDDVAPVRRSSSGRKKKSNGNGNGPMIGIMIGGGVGLVAMIVVGVLLFRPRSNDPLPSPPQTVQAVPSLPNTVPTTPAVIPPQTATTTPTTPGTTPTVPTTPTTPTTPTKPTVAAAPAAPVIDTRWQPVEAKYQITHKGKDADVVLAPGGKFVALDRSVRDMVTGDEVWSAPAAFGGGGKGDILALSPDGAIFAEGDDKGSSLTLYCREKIADETKHDLPVANGANKLTFLQFADNKRIVAAFTTGGTTRVAVYDAEKPKKPVKDFTTEGFSQKSGAISSDGKFLAVASVQTLKVYDLSKGSSVATMAAPANSPLAFNGCSGLAFSPDSDELAAVLGTGVLVWSNKGKLIEEWGDVVASNPFAKHNGLSYLPDKSGFLVNGQALFDRASKTVVWQLQQPHFYSHPAAVFDADHIIVSGGGNNNGQVAVIKIPRDELARATKAIADKVDAVLAPGSQVSVAYEIGEPRFSSRQDVTNQLHAALTAKLSKSGIVVADNQPIILKVVYTEVAGDTTEYFEGRGFGPPSPFGRRSGQPGTKVVETRHTLSAVLTRKDDPRIWWAANIVQEAPQSLKGDATEVNVRNGSFEYVKNRIGGFDLPRFVPVDTKIPSLPLKTDLGQM